MAFAQLDKDQVKELETAWSKDERWQGIKRTYSPSEVVKLRNSFHIENSIGRYGANRFWKQLKELPYVNSLGCLTGSQAVEMVKAGLNAIYLSGWQVAADANLAYETFPDQSLYPVNSVPTLVKRINNALSRMDQIDRMEGKKTCDWHVPILADAEAGFGGPVHAYVLMKSMIEAGAAAVHFEDQLASEKKCGHLGGKVLVPTSSFIRTLTGARLAADVLDVPAVIVARTDSHAATLMTSDIDKEDQRFLTGDRTPEGYYRVKCGLESAIARGLAYAPYADLIWMETSTPDIDEAKEFAMKIREKFPGKNFAYNCSPSFNWEKNLNAKQIAKFQQTLSEFGYKFQFITLAGWHLINYHTFELSRHYKDSGMTAYVDLQRAEFEKEAIGYTAVRHQREAGTNYFDQILMTISGGKASTAAYAGSTEEEQFQH